MSEGATTITIELSKAFLQQALSRKPAWVKQTDEQFLGKMVAQGNYEEFFKSYAGFEEQLAEAQKVFREALRTISMKVGAPIDPPAPTTRKKGPQPQVQATGKAENPPGQEQSAKPQKI